MCKLYHHHIIPTLDSRLFSYNHNSASLLCPRIGAFDILRRSFDTPRTRHRPHTQTPGVFLRPGVGRLEAPGSAAWGFGAGVHAAEFRHEATGLGRVREVVPSSQGRGTVGRMTSTTFARANLALSRPGELNGREIATRAGSAALGWLPQERQQPGRHVCVSVQGNAPGYVGVLVASSSPSQV